MCYNYSRTFIIRKGQYVGSVNIIGIIVLKDYYQDSIIGVIKLHALPTAEPQ